MTGFYQFMIVAKVIEARIKKQSENEQK